jgi:hypothetical protein
MTNKEFVPKELAIKLRDLGFDEPCLFVYRYNDLYMYGVGDYLTSITLAKNEQFAHPDKNYWVTAPTYSQAFRWFREEHKLNVHIEEGSLNDSYKVFVNGFKVYYGSKTSNNGEFSYDDGQELALKNLIELVEERQKKNRPVCVVEKTPHTLLIYSIMNERLYANAYPPITFGEAVQMGLTEETQERDITFILVKKFPYLT